MKIQRVFVLAVVYPFLLEPVERRRRVTAEPEPRSVNGAARHCLFDERPRHKCDLVEQYARESSPLYQHKRTFVLAAKYLENVRNITAFYGKQLVRPPPRHAVVLLDVRHRDKRRDDIFLRRTYRFSAYPETAAVEALHSPADKRYGHNRGLSRTDCTVTDYVVILRVGEGEDFLLLGANHLIWLSHIITKYRKRRSIFPRDMERAFVFQLFLWVNRATPPKVLYFSHICVHRRSFSSSTVLFGCRFQILRYEIRGYRRI